MAAPGETYRLAFPSKSKPWISMGIPFQDACAHHVTNTFHASRVYIIVSSSISKTENFAVLHKALGDKVIGVRKGIKPHTPWDDILEIVQDMRNKNADLIITLGAGSLTDGAKVIALALANNTTTLTSLSTLTLEAQSHSPTQHVHPATIPVITIPTSLSGGEYTSLAGATDPRTHHKASFAHPSIGAALVILDPRLSASTPARVWLSSGMRAVDHCVEGLCSLSPNVCAESDGRLEEGLRLLVPNLLRTKGPGGWEAEEERLGEMLGVVAAMEGLQVGVGVPMGGSHGMGHQLGPLGVGHGETSCVLLPAVLRYNALYGDTRVRTAQQKVLGVFWGEAQIAEVLRKRGLERETADAGDVVGAVVSELGLPRTLREVGVGREKLDALAENCLKDPWLESNAVPLRTKEQVLEILEMVLGEVEDSGESSNM